MKIKVITTVEELELLKNEWDALLKTAIKMWCSLPMNG